MRHEFTLLLPASSPVLQVVSLVQWGMRLLLKMQVAENMTNKTHIISILPICYFVFYFHWDQIIYCDSSAFGGFWVNTQQDIDIKWEVDYKLSFRLDVNRQQLSIPGQIVTWLYVSTLCLNFLFPNVTLSTVEQKVMWTCAINTTAAFP